MGGRFIDKTIKILKALNGIYDLRTKYTSMYDALNKVAENERTLQKMGGIINEM